MVAEPGDSDGDRVDDVTEQRYGTDHVDGTDHPWEAFGPPRLVGDDNADDSLFVWSLADDHDARDLLRADYHGRLNNMATGIDDVKSAEFDGLKKT